MDKSTLMPKLDFNDHLFITITTNDFIQHANLKPYNRLKKFTDAYFEDIKPILKYNLHSYHSVLEIGETMVTRGDKFPRLHWHILCKLKDPIGLLTDLTPLIGKHFGYHIVSKLTEDEYKFKQDYMVKQREQWKYYCKRRSKTVLYARTHDHKPSIKTK